MNYFKDYVLDPIKEGLSNDNKGIPIPLRKLSKVTNYVNKGQVYAIGGRPNSGKTSFMDFIYMINIYKWWKELSYERYEEDVYGKDGSTAIHSKGDVKYDSEGNPYEMENVSKPPLKMFYFSMKSRPQVKFQKWICLYLKLRYNTIIDIPTLTNGVGKLYNLDQDILDQVTEATNFFRDFEEDVLTFVNGKQTPTSINNRVTDYMDSIGGIQDNKFQLDNDHVGQFTFVYMDNVEELRPEMDGYASGSIESAKKKVLSFATDWKYQYNITTCMVVPSRVTNSRMVKDSEPTYKELGVFSDKVDIGLIMYNAYNENNNSYLNYPIEDMMINGKNRFRTVTVVRNNGMENITSGLIFVGECGYFRESPYPTQTSEFESYMTLFNSLA